MNIHSLIQYVFIVGQMLIYGLRIHQGMKQNFLPSWSLDTKEIKPVNPKGNQPQIFIGRTDAEAEASILGPPDVKS